MEDERRLLEALTVLSLEQAMALPFLTYRLAQEGMRVIRIEPPGRGDPNRRVGPDVVGDPERCAYFLPLNAGKLAITLNLAEPEGRALLHELIRRLPVDIFCTNNRPGSYQKLGIDEPTLRALKEDLIWVGITGYGPDQDRPAYDPIIQGEAGWMDLTGEPEGDPTVFGLPLVDLGAAEHGYGQVMKALFLRQATGRGSRIDLSLYRSALAWTVTPFALEVSFGIPNTRHGNTHQFFAPVSVYPTRDGYVYMAVGNDRQWEALTGLPAFAHLGEEAYRHNAGRIADARQLNARLAEVTRQMTTEDLLAQLRAIGVPCGRIRRVAEAAQEPEVRRLSLRSRDPATGAELRLPPPPHETAYLQSHGRELSFPPRLGEHNEQVFGEMLGYSRKQIEDWRARGIL